MMSEHNPLEGAIVPALDNHNFETGLGGGDDQPSEEDELPTYEEFNYELLNTLDRILTDGTFAYSGVLPQYPNPGLTVNNLGVIGLPLSDRDAKALISQCQQSPFGKGVRTLIDLSVRKCWELASDQFSIKNAAWPTFVNGLLDKAYQEFGLSCPRQNVSAELYKLLLYEEGAFFKPHQDSEKTPGMFGTLVVSLPSKHEGGTVVLSHNKQKYQYDSAKASEFETSFAAWYADVFHEVQPVTSGHCLVLTYNLVQQTSDVPQKAPSGDQNTHLRSLLSAYEKAIEQGWDEDVCKALGFDIYLAAFEKQIRKSDEDYEEEYDRTERFNYVVQLDGTRCAFTPDYEKTCQLETEDTDDESADESEHESFTGNAGAEATFWYRDSVVLIVPPSKRVDVAISSANLFGGANVILPDLCKKARTSELAKKQLRSLCQRVLDKHGSIPSYYTSNEQRDACMTSITIATLEHDWTDLFDLVPAVQKLNPECLEALGRQIATSGIIAYASCLESMVRAADSFSKKFDTLDSIQKTYWKTGSADQNSAKSAEFSAWHRRMLQGLLSAPGKLDKMDGTSLASLACFCDVDVAHQIMPLLKQSSAQTKTAFLRQYHIFVQNDATVSTAVHRNSLEEGLRMLWSSFQYAQPKPAVDPDLAYAYSMGLGRYAQGPNLQVLADEEENRTIMRHELKDLVDMTKQYTSMPMTQMLQVLEDALASCDGEYLKDKLVPLSASIMAGKIGPLNTEEDSSLHPAVSSYITSILCHYITKFVGKEPSRVVNYSLPTRGCGCGDCQHVNRFMVDGSRTELHYAVNKQRRAHLHSYFTDRGGSYTVDTLRHTSTHTWHVVKNTSGQKKTLQELAVRVQDAQKLLKTIGGDEKQLLKKFLGQHFEAIAACRVEKLPNLNSPRKPLKLAGSSANGAIDGSRKRPAPGEDSGEQENSVVKRGRPRFPGGVEIVDLTGL
ncbi:hypothetical protein OHC33_003217 [Knufia fluminis]|uniref:Prolyl 4-hydroxylase alpha subunit Fe(2+) 2OG dioxygenase domain-containing protein n=1 Tax=Knufia fluminis TaxID=191047 RepID=A0AAN8EX65_9EURO|nr:hypothetical protein OHC33_003217 [Knufia fluminis]